MNGQPQLQDPLWLLCLLAVPLLAWLRHRRPAAGGLTVSRLPRMAGGLWRLHLPFYLKLGAFSLLILALARPQLGYARQETTTEGIDIVIALDISGSMGAEDFQPRNRLTVAKQVVREFIDARASDRLGFVTFSGNALTRSPLTTDRRMLSLLVESVELSTQADGTAIGVALASAASRLKQSGAASKVIVLVTDGVNNAGAIAPATAASVCRGLGIKVYPIGVGTAGRVPVPITTRNPATGELEERQVVLDVTVDEELLERVAERTGGRAFRAADPETLRRVFAEIDDLEKTELEVRSYVRYREVFQPLAWAALTLLLAPLAVAALGITVEP